MAFIDHHLGKEGKRRARLGLGRSRRVYLRETRKRDLEVLVGLMYFYKGLPMGQWLGQHVLGMSEG